jgi:hypothetical protein
MKNELRTNTYLNEVKKSQNFFILFLEMGWVGWMRKEWCMKNVGRCCNYRGRRVDKIG